MARPAGILLRIVIVAFCLVLPFLVAEGAYSIWTGRSLVRSSAEGSLRIQATDEERLRAAALTPGPYMADVDPRVGRVMKGNSKRAIVGEVATTDAMGQRARRGPLPHAGAKRIVILGDSVAFGYGVPDAQTLGHHLERLLGEATPEGPKPVVYTVAIPAWNYTNAFRYLKNHLERFYPDIVLYNFIHNDLDDGFSCNELGNDNQTFDPALGTRLPLLFNTAHMRMKIGTASRRPVGYVMRYRGERSDHCDPWDHVLGTAVTPFSRDRWGGLAQEINDFSARIAGIKPGARLGVVLQWEHSLYRFCDLLVRTQCKGVETINVFDTWKREDGLPEDPHPHGRINEATALELARWLADRKWLSLDPSALPSPQPEYAARRGERLSDEALAKWVERTLDTYRKAIDSEVDMQQGTGFFQVYGGVEPDGRVGQGAFIALKNGSAREVVLELDRLPWRSSIYPFTLRVTVNGRRLEAQAIPPPQASDATALVVRWPLPPEASTQPFLDIHVEASNTVWEQVEGVSRLASFTLRRLAVE
jgi:hypothetical protein